MVLFLFNACPIFNEYTTFYLWSSPRLDIQSSFAYVAEMGGQVFIN